MACEMCQYLDWELSAQRRAIGAAWLRARDFQHRVSPYYSVLEELSSNHTLQVSIPVSTKTDEWITPEVLNHKLMHS